MADAAAQDKVGGTILYGPDGHTYFIPDSDLAAYRLPDDEAARGPQPVTSDEVTGFSAASQRPGVDFPLAVHGNFGRRVPTTGYTLYEPTVLHGDISLVFKNPQS